MIDVIDGKKIIRERDKIIIPDGVKHIPYQAFKDENVKYVEIPKTVKVICGMAFCGSNIKSVVIPEGVERIAHLAFYNCRNLESVQLPKSLEYIDEQAFSYCKSLKSIIIPESVEEIGRGAFLCCNKIEHIKLSDKTLYINEGAFKFRQTIPPLIKVDDDYVPIMALKNKHFIYDDKGNKKFIEGKITAYKAFRKIDGKLVCRDLVYHEGIMMSMDEKQLKLCCRGFHACLNPFDVFSFYCTDMDGWCSKKLKFGEDIEVHEVTMEKTLFDFSTDGTTKMCCAKITVGRKLSLSEMAEIYKNSYFFNLL